MADGTTKAIEDIRLGDEVESTDPADDQSTAKDVLRAIRTADDHEFTDLSLSDPANGSTPAQELTSTQHHPFWDATVQQWVEAANLQPGYEVRRADGGTSIVTVVRDYTTAPQAAYDLTIADLHTYYVLAGITPVLVHNSNPAQCELIFPGPNAREGV
ncbi:polymorphic toxin-type HINT domain-containing protein [Kitasatospora cineracea]|uniref:polymorphic toxin-type HINT domain-containing protein n=1 Tax=Kitasatospora cineracea TaxID=88074 RepID=UPI00341A3558